MRCGPSARVANASSSRNTISKRSPSPVTPPSVGDYLTVADTLPTPAAGQGYYYVTAETYQDLGWGNPNNYGWLRYDGEWGFWHREKANCLYLDGHVDTADYGEAFVTPTSLDDPRW